MIDVYPCPCCGYLVFGEAPGSYDICPICFWEDDVAQLRFPTTAWGPNRVSLIEAQQTFQRVGAAEERNLPHVRSPNASDVLDPEWRPVDPGRDSFEEVGVSNAAETYPRDATVLYYWRPTFWRRAV